MERVLVEDSVPVSKKVAKGNYSHSRASKPYFLRVCMRLGKMQLACERETAGISELTNSGLLSVSLALPW